MALIAFSSYLHTYELNSNIFQARHLEQQTCQLYHLASLTLLSNVSERQEPSLISKDFQRYYTAGNGGTHQMLCMFDK